MLEQLELTDDERIALEGDRDVVAALAERLANTPTPAGPTPNQFGHSGGLHPAHRTSRHAPERCVITLPQQALTPASR
jgi:hypothetical protein